MKPFATVPAVVGHRGDPSAAAENTPAAFRAAWEAGAPWVELDVRRSADDVAVVHHDPVTSDGVALINRTAGDLAARGVWALSTVLESLPPGLGVDAEVKNSPTDPDFDDDHLAVGLLAAALAQHHDERPWMTSSFNPLTVAALSAALPDVPAGLVHFASMGIGETAGVAASHGAAVLCPEVGAPGLDADGVAAAHDAGVAVLVWTVDDLDEARRLALAGVDAICTNRPGSLVDALRVG